MTTTFIQKHIERDEAQLATMRCLRRIAEESGEAYHASLFEIDVEHAEKRLALHRAELERQSSGAGR